MRLACSSCRCRTRCRLDGCARQLGAVSPASQSAQTRERRAPRGWVWAAAGQSPGPPAAAGAPARCAPPTALARRGIASRCRGQGRERLPARTAALTALGWVTFRECPGQVPAPTSPRAGTGVRRPAAERKQEPHHAHSTDDLAGGTTTTVTLGAVTSTSRRVLPSAARVQPPSKGAGLNVSACMRQSRSRVVGCCTYARPAGVSSAPKSYGSPSSRCSVPDRSCSSRSTASTTLTLASMRYCAAAAPSKPPPPCPSSGGIISRTVVVNGCARAVATAATSA